MKTAEMTSYYFVRDNRADGRVMYMSAPTGYFRKADGSIERDGTPSPEWTWKRSEAFRFKSHRAAARHTTKQHTHEIVSFP